MTTLILVHILYKIQLTECKEESKGILNFSSVSTDLLTLLAGVLEGVGIAKLILNYNVTEYL